MWTAEEKSGIFPYTKAVVYRGLHAGTGKNVTAKTSETKIEGWSPPRGPGLEHSENDAYARGTHSKEENTTLTRAKSSEKSEMGWGENIIGRGGR